MSDWDGGSGDYEYAEDWFGDRFGFSDNPDAMILFDEGFLTSSREDSEFYDPNVSMDDRWDARAEFEDLINEEYPDFDWEGFWEAWDEFYSQ